MTSDPVFAAWTKANATTLQQSYGHSFILPSGADAVSLTIAGTSFPQVLVGTTFGQGSISLGGGLVVADVSLTRTGVGTASFLGTISMAAPVISGHPTIEGITSTGATGTGKFVYSISPSISTQLDVTDGTGGHGQALLAVTPFGAVSGVYAAPSDSQPVAAVVGGAASSAWVLGPGGATVADVKVTRTGVGTATVTGTLTIPSPILTTPTLGVASATTINKVTITAPATGSTLTVADGKTATINNTLTFAGTDATTMTFPTTSATIARTDAANTFTGHQTIEGVTSTGAVGTGKFVFSDSPALTTQWDVQDGTSGHGQTKSIVSAFGALFGIYTAPGDAQVAAGMTGGAAATAWVLGAGGSTAPSFSIGFTSAALATMTGSLIGTFARSGSQTQSGTTYTLVAADAGKTVTMNNASGMTLTIPANSSVAFPIGTNIPFYNKGAGTMTLAITTDTLLGTTSYLANKGGILHKLTATIWMVLASA